MVLPAQSGPTPPWMPSTFQVNRPRQFSAPGDRGAPGISGRFLAFCLVIAGAAFMPAPMLAIPDAA
jgi:hypothetical protein